MTDTSSPAITVEHVNKSFGSFRAVKDLNFTVNQSECFGILGPNGAGKTTMMRMIYAKGHRDTDPPGTISVFGHDPSNDELSIKYFSGVVPQENSLDEELDVAQNLRIYARFYNMPRRQTEQRIDELLEFMELGAKKKARIKQLSGGMKRRLIIARALLNKPRLLFLDEPTTGLDPQVRHIIWDKLRNLRNQGMTILLTTHYMEEAFQICDRVMIMNKGERVVQGNPQQLIRDNIESFVLELLNANACKTICERLPIENVRVDESTQLIRLYSQHSEILRELGEKLNPGDYYLRQANLEDLFLKTTGSALNAQQ
ncbi:MAG: ABC transporter ATP-binding protein [Chitinispirillaceae bacterium]